jgi:hypothetical protein
MPRQPVSNLPTLEERIFHSDGKGLRGITLLAASGRRGDALSVAVHDSEGKRKNITTLSLKGQDFNSQWVKAVDAIAAYHGDKVDNGLRRTMYEASGAFLKRYRLTLTPVVVAYHEASTEAAEPC